MGSPLQGNYLLGDTCRRQHDRPRFRVAKPLKGFAPLLFRECRRLSSCKRKCVRLGQGEHNPNATFQCVAYTLRPVSDEISHFSRQTEMPLIGRPFLWEVVDCHFTLPFVPVEWASPRQPLLAQVLAYLCHNQEVTASHRFTGRRPRNAPR